MQVRQTLIALSIASAVALYALPSNACFTVIVGKNISTTGEIIVGHNEDNDLRILSNQYYVPPADHKAGEVIDMEPSAAKIPQVAHTLGYWWQQTLHPDGYSFSDSFVNEAGVLVTSNNCGETIEANEPVVDGGVGYGIRRLIAERAKTAREGVEIAIALVKRYGYTHQGRTYTIADKNEAWQLALLRGHRYLARRVSNDEMTAMANTYSLGEVDLTDKENVIASPDLVENAVKKGTFKPKKPSDATGFHFRNAYQLDSRVSADWTKERMRTMIRHFTGKDVKDPYKFPMTFTPKKKISPEDVRTIIRLNNPNEKRASGFHHESMNDVSNIGTFDSAVFVMTQDPRLTYTWRTSGRPDSQYSYAQFVLAGPAKAQNYLSPKEGMRAQFRSTASDLNYDPDRTVYTFLNWQNMIDWNKEAFKNFKRTQKEAEVLFARNHKVDLKKAKQLLAVNPAKAFEFMHAVNVSNFDVVLGMTAAELSKINRYTITIGAKELSKSDDKGTINVTLFSHKGFDATKIDTAKTVFGDPYPNPDVDLNVNRAKVSSVKFVDVDGDGLKDAVLTFPVKGAVADTFAGVTSELYLWTEVDKKRIVAFDTVKIVK